MDLTPRNTHFGLVYFKNFTLHTFNDVLHAFSIFCMHTLSRYLPPLGKD